MTVVKLVYEELNESQQAEVLKFMENMYEMNVYVECSIPGGIKNPRPKP